jgi:hypothetical protein
MTALVLYGGAGINVIFYCCNQCRSTGIETLHKDNCCEIHNQTCDHNSHSSEPAKSTCHSDYEDNGHPADYVAYYNHYNNEYAEDDCCNIKRINFDWCSHSFSELEINLLPAVFNLLPYAIVDISNIDHLTVEIGVIMPKGPPVYPRDYLSKYTVLLI